MGKIKKIIALLLVFCMIIGLVPVNTMPVEAAGETVYVLAGSDFQPTDGSTTTGVNLVNGILEQIKTKYAAMDGFIFAGDYDYNYTNSAAGKEALQDAVQAVYGTKMNEVYIQGNHDVDSLVGSTLAASGNNDTDNYGVFVINEKDYMWYNDDETTIKNTAANLETYLNAKRNAGYTKPIFVVSHLPLHYCMRTQVGGGDGKHANYIFDVLNEAGEAGLNIIFMFGHNHSHGWDDPYGGAAIFLKKGDSINIAQNSTTNYNVETLNFTYMNAGYVSYYRNVNSGAETDLSMTTFAITDTDVTIERYTADGLHDLKSAGVANTHASTGSSVDGSCSTNHGGNETYSPDTSTVASAYTLTLNTEITPAGTEVVAPDTDSTATQRTYTRVTSTSDLVSGGQYLIIENSDTDYFMLPESISNDAGDRIGYNIESTTVAGGDTITGDYSAKEWTMTGSGESWTLSTSSGSAYMEYQSSSRAYGRISSSNSSTFTIGGSANAFTFSTTTNGYTYVFDHSSAGLINGYVKTPSTTFYIYRLTNEGSSTPTVDTYGGNWVTITEPIAGGTRYKYELDTDGIDEGVEYLIVANSYEYALSAAASSNNRVEIDIVGNYAYADSDTYGWTFATYSSGVYYVKLNDSTYLRFEYNTKTISSSSSIGNSNNQRRQRQWQITSNGDGSYKMVSNSNNIYELRWSNSNDVFQVSSSNDGPVRLYKYVDTETTQATAGLYGKIDGELTYNVTVGTSAADAIAKVKEGITVYYTDNASATTGTEYPDDGDGMTWTIDPDYDGTTPGEYAVTIAYNGVVLGVAKVVVPSVAVKGYSINPLSSTVRQGASQTLYTGSVITVTLENGDYYTVPVSVSMLSKDGNPIDTSVVGTQTGLTVTYNGVKITDNYTLNIIEKVKNDYPEYPDEGAVKVNKTATGIDFQSSGVAKVELSTSGVPSQKGADVVIVIDTSSSMDKDIDGEDPTNGEKSRIEILSESLEQMLLQFQQPDDTGIYPDIDLAIIDFNGYTSVDGVTTEIDEVSLNGSYRDDQDLAEVYTGTTKGYIKQVGLSADNFVDNLSISAEETAAMFDEQKTSSGTNYDGGLNNAYKLLELKKAANGEEERDQYVIFLSDGAPFRYNGFNNGGSDYYNEWNNWLSGYWTADTLKAAYADNSFTYFYNGNGTSHPHRIAEAIKGTEGAIYNVVDSTASENDPAYISQYSGLGAKIYSIGFGLAPDGDNTKGYVTVSAMQNVLQTISSGDGFYYDVDTSEELTTAFTQIANAINYAATNAYFVDQMGDAFNIQMATVKYAPEGSTSETATITPTIEVKAYDIYTRTDYLEGKCTESQIGDRKGTYSVIETVTFTDDGAGNVTGAYSDLIYTTDSSGNKTYTNILGDGSQDGFTKGIIYAKNFVYNTTTSDVAVNGITVAAESFYWNVGTVTTTELALSYYVYLTGSMEGTREDGSYETNNYATLYYENYLGNDCYKDTVSPAVAWDSALVKYAFYLVDSNGNPVNSNGDVVTFANKVAVTQPVVYQEILLNNLESVNSISVASLGNLPEGYTLYDRDSVYTVTINSNSTGKWQIAKNGSLEATTYVMQFDPDNASAYDNTLNVSSNDEGCANYDFTHTVVWFAVVWEPKCLPDTVVIDYGLPVDIHVLGNDMFGDYGKLVGVTNGTVTGSATGDASNQITGTSATGTYGSTSVITTDSSGAALDKDDCVIRYTPTTIAMNSYDTFMYSVNYTGAANSGYYYGDVTVIPATTVYYEDNFNGNEVITYTKYSKAEGSSTFTSTNGWENAGEAITDAVQAEDRPAEFSLSYYDANNLYGYDSAYSTMTKYSLGSAKKIHVDANNYGTAEFAFYGTGFDIIAMTDNTTGCLVMQVFDTDNKLIKSVIVDTYYGYTYKEVDVTNEDGTTTKEWQWVAGADNGAIYQVPVMKLTDLEYGKYTVKLTATYFETFDQTTANGYDLYLDAVRIYDPVPTDVSVNSTTTVGDIYKMDKEGWPEYFELRNNILDSSAISADGVAEIAGLVFIDGIPSTAAFSDYAGYGPNNELYLAPGQAVAFELDLSDYVDTEGHSIVSAVHLGIKNASEKSSSYKIFDASTISKQEDLDSVTTHTLDTSTDMYYDITSLKNSTIVIANTGASGMVSLTNLKITFTEQPNTVSDVIYSNGDVSKNLLESLNTDGVFDSDEKIVVTVPESTTKGETITVKVETSDYVEAVTVNGVAIEYYKETTNEDNSVTRYWTINVDCEESGDKEISVTGYNAAGAPSTAVVNTVTVNAATSNVVVETIRTAINKIMNWLFGN